MIRFVPKIHQRAATDGHTPDEVAKRFSAGLSRRRACRALGGGALGMVVSGLGLTDVLAGCRGVGERCRRRSQCCSNRCVRNKCRRGKDPKIPPSSDIPLLDVPPPLDIPLPPAWDTPPPLVKERDREPRATVYYSATMEIVDDETFGSDEHCNYSFDDFSTPLLTSGAPTYSIVWIRGCGGEVRVELTLDLTLRENGDVAISGRVYLFEGTSERTTDLDGQEEISEFVVAPGASVVKDVTVRNEREGGDRADIRLTFRNVAA